MSYDLRDVLEIAKEGAPPPRNGVDDIVANGRRLQRRRRTAWLSGSAAVVALVAAGAVAVPTFAGGGGGGVGQESAAAPGDGPVTFPVPSAPFDMSVGASTVGNYRITAPLLVNATAQQSNVYREGQREQTVEESDGTRRSYASSVATVTVYRPGAFDPKDYAGGSAVTVRTRPGLLADLDTSVSVVRPGEKPDSTTEKFPSLAWQYADNAWATIVVDAEFGRDAARTDLVRIAAGVAPSALTPVKVPFSLRYKPTGWTLLDAGLGGEGGFEETRGALRFIGAPTRDPEGGVRVTVYQGKAKYRTAGKPTSCDGAQPSICDRDLGNGWFVEIVDGYGTMSETELRRVVDGVVPAPSFTDRAGWTAAADL
jgi:hypothetical protein